MFECPLSQKEAYSNKLKDELEVSQKEVCKDELEVFTINLMIAKVSFLLFICLSPLSLFFISSLTPPPPPSIPHPELQYRKTLRP